MCLEFKFKFLFMLVDPVARKILHLYRCKQFCFEEELRKKILEEEPGINNCQSSL